MSIIEGMIKKVGATGLKDMGKVMSAVLSKTRGRADGKSVNSLVKEVLNNK